MKDLSKDRNKLDNKLLAFLADYDSETKLFEVQKAASSLFTALENELCKEIKRNDSLSKTELEDDLATIENILEVAVQYAELMKCWHTKHNKTYAFAPNTLSTAESVLNYYKQERAMNYKKKLNENDFPINGFNKKLPLQNKKKDVACIVLGSLLLISALIINFITDCNFGNSYLLFRGFFALGIALIASGTLVGFVKAKIESEFKIAGIQLTRAKITAGGTIVIFLLLYFANPPLPPQPGEISSHTSTEVEQR
jgi:hypothetical protein